jgi:dynein heavy chain
MIEANG